MRHPKLVAALAALTLTVGGLALAGPALAQEVPSSPDTPVQTSTETAPTEAPTAPETTDNSSIWPEVPSAIPEAEAPVDPAPPTEPTTTESSTPTLTPSEPSIAAGPDSTSGSALSTDPTPSTSLNSRPVASVPIEGWWAMPNGGTSTNVTWPQTVADSGNLACGVWYQVDTYPSAEVLAMLAADGQLDQGEDYSTVISWRFVYGGDCPPAPGPANPAATIETQCGLATVTVTNDGENILTASVVIYLDGDFLTALAIPAGQSVATPVGFAEDSGDHVLSVRTGPAFGDVELARAENINSDCTAPPVVTPPTVEPPAVVPSVVTPTPEAVTPTEARTIAAQEVASEKLAATGSDVEGYVQIGAWAAGLTLLAGLVIVIIRRRVPKQK